MFSYTQVEEKLATSKWSQYAIGALIPVLPRLGKWSLSFLWKHLHSYMEGDEADDIAQIISSEPGWYEAIKRNDSSEIGKVIKMAIEHYDTIESKAVLSMILDARNNKEIADVISKELSRTMDELEVLHLVDLPPGEVVNMLTYRINNIIAIADLNMEIKRYLYYRDTAEADDEELIRFKQALENNSQLIGSNPLPVSGWLNEFAQMAVKSNTRSTYNVAFFMINSGKAQKLNEQEKKVLAEILQLHNWLLQPLVTETEIKGYELQKFAPPADVLDAKVPEVTQPVNLNLNQPPVGTYEEPRSAEPKSSNVYAPRPTEQTPPQVAEPTEEQKRALEEIRRAEHSKGKYDSQMPQVSSPLSAADNARIHDLINQKLKAAATKRGVTMDPTNIKIEEEKQRLEQQRAKQVADIQRKLAELRERNKDPKQNV